MVNRWLVALVVIVLLATTQPGFTAPVADAQFSAMADRLFPVVHGIVPARLDAGARRLLNDRRQRIDACHQEPSCLLNASLWSEHEMSALASAQERAVSGRKEPLSLPDDGLQAQIIREFTGLNNILSVYGLGRDARYPQIDGPVDSAGTQPFTTNLANAIFLADSARQDPAVALDSSIGLALALLDANHRDEMVAFEPLDARFNAEALARARTVDWAAFRYSAIIVLGVGPDDLSTPLSTLGKLNVRMAAERFADKVAPFIIVSGSSVHPRGARFVEAVEMRKALIERFGIAPENIVLEPYARHTTTNLRNATRRLMALGASLDRDALIISNAKHCSYIQSRIFVDRNERELGYQPGTIGKPLSQTEILFRPNRASARVDPFDPLDP